MNDIDLDSGLYFYKVAKRSQIRDGDTIEISIGDKEILLCCHNNEIFAIENLCTHQDRKLTGGYLSAGQIFCPFHGASFELSNGKACDPPATCPIKTFNVRIVDGNIEVAAQGKVRF